MRPLEFGPRGCNKKNMIVLRRDTCQNIKVDKYLFQALTQYWNPAYSCFTFG
ncbi:hypothetical protein Gotri_027196 [Gossypium trilobum]|uniref:Uncharacterized protein n=1 Tax=Gossypium trilobum TaxID=34281 RepID=A0A7J9FKR3_9ROSI|nr:hypothetical protein [Gossypium trilobum]